MAAALSRNSSAWTKSRWLSARRPRRIQIAESLGLNYKTVHRSPSAEAIQPSLKPLKRSLEILHEFFGKPETVRVWLNTSHPDLDGGTAMEMMLANKADAVLRILEDAAAGVPI